MENFEKRLDLAFQFLGDVMDDASLLDLIPDGATVILVNPADPKLRQQSHQLLADTKGAQGAARVVLTLVKEHEGHSSLESRDVWAST